MTEAVFLKEPYERETVGQVVAHTPEGGIVLDRTNFYATGGGQPGDSGSISWAGGRLEIATCVKSREAGSQALALVPAEPAALPEIGTQVHQQIDWDRRHSHMRVHTALHLLSVVVPFPVSGGAISAGKGRLDFDMPENPDDKEALEHSLNALIERDYPVSEEWISDAALAANPGLVKTMSVRPPVGQGQVRLIRIGDATRQIDLQPCGGTHVARTSEIGALRVGKFEKKGRQNRRIYLHLDN